jgi:hypothetical protein
MRAILALVAAVMLVSAIAAPASAGRYVYNGKTYHYKHDGKYYNHRHCYRGAPHHCWYR